MTLRKPIKTHLTKAQPTLYDEFAETSEGARELAAADLALHVGDLLRTAFRRSGLSNHDFAERLGVSDGRASQVLNSDGNLRISTLAKALNSLGLRAVLDVRNADGSELVEKPTARKPKRHAPDDWIQPTCTNYSVMVMDDRGVGRLSFDLHHEQEQPPVILEVPRPSGVFKSAWNLQHVADLIEEDARTSHAKESA